MNDPTLAAEGVLIDGPDPREEGFDFSDTDYTFVDQLVQEEEAPPIYPEGYEVAICPIEMEAPRPEFTGAELLLDSDKAQRLLDDIAPSWRSWGQPPGIPCHGRGWSGVWYSRDELVGWVEKRGARWTEYHTR